VIAGNAGWRPLGLPTRRPTSLASSSFLVAGAQANACWGYPPTTLEHARPRALKNAQAASPLKRPAAWCPQR